MDRGVMEMRVLLVCMGNICRSPMAHGVVRARLEAAGLAARVGLDSAGTHGYHAGAPPDERAQAAARRRGIDISDLRARLVVAEDFETFDLILAMDDENVETLLQAAGEAHRHKIHLLMHYALGEPGRTVPDPYYGGPIGFERVLDMVEEAAESLLARLQQELAGR
ncbi:MAG: low molecular weight phosphotyrosine protein phosphatase [Gammaproteobacteria bacterium]|nr:low molecular weight phosphotyrosine protein phosphatase [Gammaproteobacteria bacterium]